MNWESAFFGYPVAQIYPPFNPETLNALIEQLRTGGYVFAYAFCPPPSTEQHAMELAGAGIAATRVVFKRSLVDMVQPFTNLAEEFPVDGTSEILQTLAIQSGVYSRYRRDRHFPPGSFEAMYAIWMKKSISHELADVVLIIRENELIAGMVTVKKDGEIARIGLFAVLNVFRRKGIGSQLMQSAFAWAVNNNCHELQVVGQIENRDACRFYEKMGMDMIDIQHAMHLWL